MVKCSLVSLLQEGTEEEWFLSYVWDTKALERNSPTSLNLTYSELPSEKLVLLEEV